jgi:hypothetical protein
MKRQYHLDWIRVLATIVVFIYHCFMFFNPWAWHVKNNDLDPSYITAISLGFFISDIGWSIPLKLIFLSVVSFTIIMILFHFGISKVSFIRILFGMKGDFGPTINEKPNKGTTKKVGF